MKASPTAATAARKRALATIGNENDTAALRPAGSESEGDITRRNSRLIQLLYLSLCLFSALIPMQSLAGSPDPCSLLATAEVEQVVGPLKGNPKGDKEGEAAWCNYEFANRKDLMDVWVFPAEAIERGRKVSKKPVAVKGLGDDAFMDRGMHGINYVNLFVRKGSTTVKFSIQETSGDEDKLKRLAQKAAGRF